MERESSLSDLIDELLKSAEDRLDAAEILLSKGKLVDAVNRTYAAFNAAKALLNSMGKDPKTHSGLISEFGLHVVNANVLPKKHGVTLRRSFEARESGDYTVAAEFDESEVRALISDVKELIGACRKAASEQLKDGG